MIKVEYFWMKVASAIYTRLVFFQTGDVRSDTCLLRTINAGPYLSTLLCF